MFLVFTKTNWLTLKTDEYMTKYYIKNRYFYEENSLCISAVVD